MQEYIKKGVCMYTLITGASSGIGAEFAHQLAEKKHDLILTARSVDVLNKTAQDLEMNYHVDVKVIGQDLSEIDGPEALFAKCLEQGLEIDLLINDAGVGLIGDFESHDIKNIEQMLILNILSLTKLCYLFLPQLKTNKGKLLNVSSQAAFGPQPYMAAYGATKAYVLSLTEALRVELENTGVTVHSLNPGPTDTKFFERANASPDDVNFKIRSPQEVVAEAIVGIESNKAITIPGWDNQVFNFVSRLVPRTVLAKMTQYTIKK